MTPVKALDPPESVSVPVPVFVSPTMPGVVNTPLVIVPANDVLREFPPITYVTAPASFVAPWSFVPVPPVREPTCTVAAKAVRIAAVLTPRSNWAVPLPVAADALSRMLPDEGPKSSVPAKPARLPASVRLPVVVVAIPSRCDADPLTAPLSVIPPAESVPLASITIGVAMPETDPKATSPPPSRIVPGPAAATWLRASVPALTRTLPSKELDPVSVSVPAPFFVRPPLPVRTPLQVPLKPLVAMVPPAGPTTVGTATFGDAVRWTAPAVQSNRPPAEPARMNAACRVPPVITRMPAVGVVPESPPRTISPAATDPPVIESVPSPDGPRCSRSKMSRLPPVTFSRPGPPSPIESRLASAWPVARPEVPETAAAVENVGTPPDQDPAPPQVPLATVQRLAVSLAPSSLRYSSRLVYPPDNVFQSVALAGLSPRERSHPSGMPSLSVSASRPNATRGAAKVGNRSVSRRITPPSVP